MLGMIRLYMHFNPVIVRQSRLYYVPDPFNLAASHRPSAVHLRQISGYDMLTPP